MRILRGLYQGKNLQAKYDYCLLEIAHHIGLSANLSCQFCQTERATHNQNCPSLECYLILARNSSQLGSTDWSGRHVLTIDEGPQVNVDYLFEQRSYPTIHKDRRMTCPTNDSKTQTEIAIPSTHRGLFTSPLIRAGRLFFPTKKHLRLDLPFVVETSHGR